MGSEQAAKGGTQGGHQTQVRGIKEGLIQDMVPKPRLEVSQMRLAKKSGKKVVSTGRKEYAQSLQASLRT